MARQREALAYGRPDYGGIVIGGENVGVYSLGNDWEDTADITGVRVTCSVWVHGDEDQREERYSVLKAALKDLGNLCISFGEDLSAIVSIATATGVMTITAGSAVFVDAHLGHPVHLEGLGSFQVTEVTSPTVLKCKLPTGTTAPADQAGVSLSIGKTQRRIIEASKTEGFSVRPSLRRAASAEDEPDRRRYVLELVAGRPASESRQDDRQFASVRFEAGPGGERQARFSGTYTASGGENARTRYLAAIDTYISGVMEAWLGPGASFGPVGDDVTRFIDDTNNVLQFELVRREIRVNEALGQVDHPAINEATLILTRPRRNDVGISGAVSRSTVTMNYSCRINRSKLPEDIQAFYDAVIYPFIVQSAADVFGSRISVALDSGPGYNLHTQRLSAQVVGTLIDLGNAISRYTRTVRYGISQRKVHRDRYDGEEFTAHRYSPGRLAQAIVTVSYSEMVAAGGPRSPRGVVNPGIEDSQALGIFSAASGPFGLSFGGPDGDVRDAGTGFEPLAPPQRLDERYPDAGFSGEGRWDPLDLIDEETIRVTGEDGLGVSTPALETRHLLIQRYRWWVPKGSIERSGARDLTGSVPGASRTTTVERDGS